MCWRSGLCYSLGIILFYLWLEFKDCSPPHNDLHLLCVPFLFFKSVSFGLDPLTSRLGILSALWFSLLVWLFFEFYGCALRFFNSIFISTWVLFNVPISWLNNTVTFSTVSIISIIFMIVLPWVSLKRRISFSFISLSSFLVSPSNSWTSLMIVLLILCPRVHLVQNIGKYSYRLVVSEEKMLAWSSMSLFLWWDLDMWTSFDSSEFVIDRACWV